MTAKRGVCLIRFDDQFGPGCLYSEGLDYSFAEKVSMKSHLSTLSLTSGSEIQKEDFVESVIPFLDEGYVAYSTFFFVKDESARGGRRALGIVALVDRSEQMSLYKSIPEISNSVRKIAEEIFKEGDPKGNLSDEVKDRLNELLKLETLPNALIDPTQSTDMVKNRVEKQQLQLKKEQQLFQKNINGKKPELIQLGGFEFLLERISKYMDRVIHALLKNERILVVGKEEEIIAVLSTLKEFLPHKKIYSNLWTIPLLDAEALFSQSANQTILHVLAIRDDVFYDIIEINKSEYSEELLSQCIDEKMTKLKDLPIKSKIVIDFNRGIVFGGVPNRFCEKLVDSINGCSNEKSKKLIERQIKYLLDRVNQITEIFLLNDKPDINRVTQFLSNASEGEVSLIISIIEDINQQLLEKIISFFSFHQLSLEVLF